MTAKGDWLNAVIEKHGTELIDRVMSVFGRDVEPAVVKRAVAREAKASAPPAPTGSSEVTVPKTRARARPARRPQKPLAVVLPAPKAVAEYADPSVSVIPDWNWRPLPEVYEQLGGLSSIPPHVLDFGNFMDEQAARAGREGLSARDLIKAFTVTRSSIQRQATDAENLRRAGLRLPDEVTGEVRPEGAFGEWLGTPAGQAYLDAAQNGRLSGNAIGDAVARMSPFGKQNDIRDALEWAALNLPGRESEVSDLVAAGREMASTPTEWRRFTKDVRGIGPSKSGFLASLLGRGDQPTLDARQIILNTAAPTKDASRYLARQRGAGGVEGVERLAARQRALGLELPPELNPYYQHLAHHAIWDKAGDETTTHADVVNAMKNFAVGGAARRPK